MQVSKDALWKGIIESLVDDFIRFFFPKYVEVIDFEQGFEFCDAELQKLTPDHPDQKRHVDKLIKARLKSGEEIGFLIHVQVPDYPDPHFDRHLYECVCRIGDKFQHPLTGLVIYTDGNRKYHFSNYQTSFMGSALTYKFNSYVLCDYLPASLSQNPNLFAVVLEAAWQYLDKPSDEQKLLVLKLGLVERLQQRSIPPEKMEDLIDFIKMFVPFTTSEMQAKFEQDLLTITQNKVPMGIREAILEDAKNQGIEEGIEIGISKGLERGLEKGWAKGLEQGLGQGLAQGIEIGEAKQEESFLQQAVPALVKENFSVEKISSILHVPVEKVMDVIALRILE